MEAVIIVGQLTAAAGARLSRFHNKGQTHVTRKARLGIPAAEERIRLDRLIYVSNSGE